MKELSRLLWVAVFCITVNLLCIAPALSKDDQKPVHIRLATTGIGSGWYIYGANLAQLIRKQLPPGSTVDVLPFSGGVGNPKLVEKGDAEFALAHTTTAYWAREGKEGYKQPLKNVTGVAGGLDKYWLGFMVTKQSGLSSLDDVKGKKVPLRLLTVPIGGLGEAGTRLALQAYGTSYDELKANGGSVRHIPRPPVPGLIREGKADAWSHVVNIGHPTATELSTVTDMVFLSLKPEVIAELTKVGFTEEEMPAGLFKGQDKPVATVGAPTVLIARADLPEDLVYLVTKTLAENKPKLVKGHAAMKAFDPKTAWKPEKVQAPLHPGAARYYKEQGWMK